ncbi:hypothetical protein IKD48_01000 [bacterium]|nr:hypothetical protein [bacterium]
MLLLVTSPLFIFQTPKVVPSDNEFGQIVNHNDNKKAQTNKHHDTIKNIFKIKLKIVELKRAIFLLFKSKNFIDYIINLFFFVSFFYFFLCFFLFFNVLFVVNSTLFNS